MTLKDVCGYIMLENFIGYVRRTFSRLIRSIRLHYSRLVAYNTSAILRCSVHCTIS